MSDLVKQLRSVGNGDTWSSYEVLGLVARAADRIAELEASLRYLDASLKVTNNQDDWMSRALKLETALRDLCNEIADMEDHGDAADDSNCPICIAYKRAREVLEG